MAYPTRHRRGGVAVAVVVGSPQPSIWAGIAE